MPTENEVLSAVHLKEMRVFTHTQSDAVLLRVRTSQPGDTWYSLARADFIELAKYLADQAAAMHPHQ